MTFDHPAWCARTEPEGADHVSATLHAAEPDDIIDIRVRLSQLQAGTDLKLLEVEFVEDGTTTTTHLMPLGQARSLVETICRLLR